MEMLLILEEFNSVNSVRFKGGKKQMILVVSWSQTGGGSCRSLAAAPIVCVRSSGNIQDSIIGQRERRGEFLWL